MSTSRRDILKGSLLAAAGFALSIADTSPGAPSATQTGSDRSIDVEITAPDGRRLTKIPPLQWGETRSDQTPLITINPSEILHPILGFGAAFTEASCVVLNRLPGDQRRELLTELLGPKRDAFWAGFSVARVCIGASDYCTSVYSYDEGAEPDPEISRFSIDRDRPAVLPILRQARAENPNLFIFGSPWSPPAWMKYGASMLGGSIHPRDLAPYARYFEKYLQQYAAAGVPINAVTVQNEIGADQDARMPACTWPEEIEARFVSRHLGPRLRNTSPRTQLWIHDHNYDMAGRVSDQLTKPTMRSFVDAVAWHGYEGRPEQMGAVHQEYPQIPMHWTEGGPNLGDPRYETDWTQWATTFASILRNGCRSITAWNVALDEQGKPNTGPFRCAGLLTVDSKTGQVTRSGMYWALAHHARGFQRDARLIGSRGTVAEISHIAAVNPDGSTALILTNGSRVDQSLRIVCGERSVEMHLPTDAVATLKWNA